MNGHVFNKALPVNCFFFLHPALVVALFMLVTSASCYALSPQIQLSHNTQPSLIISANEDLYSLHAEMMPLNKVLQQLGQQAGFRLRIQGTLNDAIGSWSFETQPVLHIVHALVRNYSTVMLYQSGKSDAVEPRLVELWIYGRGSNANQGSVQVELQGSDEIQNKQEIEAIDRLEGLTDMHTVETLANIIRTAEDAAVRRQAVAALNEIGGIQTLPLLEVAMIDNSVSVRQEVAHGLGQIQQQAALLILGQLLMGDSEASVREAAVRAIFQHPGQAAQTFIDAAQNDQSETVRRTARHLRSLQRDNVD
jgi:hypothetical protein